jgi:hypothetical protein
LKKIRFRLRALSTSRSKDIAIKRRLARAVSARGAIDLHEIARPEILDASRIERNHLRAHTSRRLDIAANTAEWLNPRWPLAPNKREGRSVERS